MAELSRVVFPGPEGVALVLGGRGLAAQRWRCGDLELKGRRWNALWGLHLESVRQEPL